MNGTGTADSDTTHASKHLADRLVVTGQNLVGAALNLAGGGRDVELVACGTPTNEQLEVLLPNDVAAGTYTLTATNQAGSCSTTVTLLQGEKGDQGLAGSYVIGDGLAGAGSDLALKSCPDGQILYHASGVWQCALANDALDSSLMPKSKMIWGIVLHNSAVDATHCLVDESSVADTTCTWDGTTHTFTVSTPGRTTHYANDAVVASVGWCSNCGSPANLSVRVDPQGGTDTIIFVVPGWVSGDVRINYIMVTND